MTLRQRDERPVQCFAIGDRIETTRALHLEDGVIADRSAGFVVDLCGPLQVLVRIAGRRQGIRLSKSMIRLRV